MTPPARVPPAERRRSRSAPPTPGSIFLDLEGSWHDPEPRSGAAPPAARDSGSTSVVFVHDVMPVIHPEWFDPRHIAVFEAWLRRASPVEHPLPRATPSAPRRTCGCSGRPGHVERSGEARRRRGPARSRLRHRWTEPPRDPRRSSPCPPTSDGSCWSSGRSNRARTSASCSTRSTVCAATTPTSAVVFVGKEGWMVDDLVHRIRTHPEYERRLMWFGGIDDAELSWLVRARVPRRRPRPGTRASACPVIEALAHGCADDRVDRWRPARGRRGLHRADRPRRPRRSHRPGATPPGRPRAPRGDGRPGPRVRAAVVVRDDAGRLGGPAHAAAAPS